MTRSRPGLVGVFAKVPAPGLVKTRLAAAVGERRAAALARAFLIDTWRAVTALESGRVVLFLDGDGALPELDPKPEVRRQIDADLGGRMEHALGEGLAEGSPWAIVVGSDLPGLPRGLLEAAIAAFCAGSDCVVGPTLDGGFYLLGLTRCPRGLLSGLPWSSPGTCRATLERLNERGLSPRVLDPWFDVDEAADLDRLEEALAAGTVVAPATASALLPPGRMLAP